MATDVRVAHPERAGWRITASAPCVGVGFWAMTVCVGTVGAFAGSKVLLAPGVGRVSAVVAAVAWFGVGVAFQMRARRGLAGWYWLTVLLAGVAARAVTGRMPAFPANVLALGAVLWCMTAVWWYARSSVDVSGPRWQLFFWSTLIVAVALGDVLSPLPGGVLGAAAGVGLLVLVSWRWQAVRTVAFWAAYALVQPFGTGIESYAATSRHSGGLGVGATDTIEFFVLSALSLLAYQAGSRDTQER